MTPEQALDLLAAAARKVLTIEQLGSYQQAVALLLPLVRPVQIPPVTTNE